MQEAVTRKLRRLGNDWIFLAAVAAGAVALVLSNIIMLPSYLLAIAPEIYYALRGLIREM